MKLTQLRSPNTKTIQMTMSMSDNKLAKMLMDAATLTGFATGIG